MALKSPWPTIDPGEFRHQIEFLNQGSVNDASGASIQWTPSSPPVKVWAKIESVRGIDVIRSGQDTAQVFLTVTIWYRAGTSPNTRIQTPNGSQFVVQAIENVLEMNTYMVLTCLGLGANE